MAIVQGIKEKVHLPIYDSIKVEPEKQLKDTESSSTLRFFVDVQGKTKLETNLQSASLLPHYNPFEARAMRVVISDLPPEFPDVPKGTGEDLEVLDDKDNPFTFGVDKKVVVADVELDLKRLMELLQEARDQDGTDIPAYDGGVTLRFEDGNPLSDPDEKTVKDTGTVSLSVKDLEDIIDSLDRKAPPREQIRPNDGAGTIISKLIYNTVTTFFVGEKIMIQMPTYFFPAGAGPYSEAGKFTTHGEPSPTATFRFAEPIFVDKQQNFRVEIEIPDADVLKDIQK